MWESTPLADLVRDAVTPEGMTYRKLAEGAIDPQTRQAVSHNTLWKIANGQYVQVQPWLVRGIAAGIGRDLRDVQLAAAEQYIGVTAGDPLKMSDDGATVVVAHVAGINPTHLPNIEEFIRNLAASDASS